MQLFEKAFDSAAFFQSFQKFKPTLTLQKINRAAFFWLASAQKAASAFHNVGQEEYIFGAEEITIKEQRVFFCLVIFSNLPLEPNRR